MELVPEPAPHTPAEMQNSEYLLDSFYEADQSYGEQLLAMKHTHPIFELAIDLQLEISAMKAEANELELGKILTDMKERTDKLDETLREAGLFDLPVILSGEGILMPNARKTPELNSTIVQSRTDERFKQELSFGQEIGGTFKGYETRIEMFGEGDEVYIKPVLVYQVEVGDINSPHIFGSLCAIGDVGVTQLEFAEDRKNQRVADLLTILMDTDDEILINTIDTLNTTLATSPQDATYMRKVGFDVAKILNGTSSVTQQYLDCVLDLIRTYVEFDRLYSVAARPLLKLPRTNPRTNGPLELFDAAPYLTISALMRDVVVMPVYKKVEEELLETTRRALYVATYSDDASWYIKLTDIEIFTRH